MAELFGFEFKRKDKNQELPSFTPKEVDDGALVVSASGAYGTYIDLEGTVRSEGELVTRYRDMSLHPEIDIAIDEIVNESISIDEDDIVNIILDDINIPQKVKDAIIKEFANVLKILAFNKQGYDIFRRWYIDGRLYFHVIIDEKNIKEGIKELRFIDPRKIRKVREISRKRTRGTDPSSTASVTKTENEYFVYNDRGFNTGNKVTPTAALNNTSGLKIAKDSIIYTSSGLTDVKGSTVLSYLHKAIKPLNQLRTLEDAVVIYRISRAPERRLWYIDVGNLPKMKAEQYVRDVMTKHKNKLVYDASSGEVRDDRKFMTLLEDYWLPRREGGRGTEVDTLPGGQNLGEMDDVTYFREKLYGSLYVPQNRLDKNNLFNIGTSSEITREELRFGKFITRLRSRFSELFIAALGKQLVLKGILTIEDWEEIKNLIKFDYIKDVYFTELKNAEILTNRLNIATMADALVGRYLSIEWVRRNVLKQDDQDFEEISGQMEVENQKLVDDAMNAGLNDPTAQASQSDQQQQLASADSKNIIDMATKTYEQLIDKNPKTMDDIVKLQKVAQIIAKSGDAKAKQVLQQSQKSA